MTHALMRPIAFALALVALACGGGNDAATTTPTTVAAPREELFEGKLLSSGNSTFFSFTVATSGDVSVTLASVTTTTTPGSSTNLVLGIGLGSPLATDCNVNPATQINTAPGLTAQLVSNNVSPAIYCVRVFDVGHLTVPVNFAVRIVHT